MERTRTTSYAGRLAVVIALVVLALLLPWAPATATSPHLDAGGTDPESTLAERFSPVMALVRQDEECRPGEAYPPVSVDPLLDNPTVALRGPWTQRDLVTAGPSAEELGKGLPGYELDFPGNPLRPGCGYEKWQRTFWGAHPEPTVYAHVATQADVPGRLALQYFFFYVFNDYNNKHEGDWERIQLEFDAPDAATALHEDLEPTRAVYSTHYGGEQASWTSGKVEILDQTHPVVYVSEGSHASQFSAGVFMGNSAATGFGCDTTVGPHRKLWPTVDTIPSNAAAAKAAYPWIAFRGHWGEVGSQGMYSGPTGPNMKTAWTRPFDWSAQARAESFALPGAAVAGSSAASFYCGAVGRGSDLLRSYVLHPAGALAVLAVALGACLWLVRRTAWHSAPHPLRRARRPGEVVHAALQLLGEHRRTFLLLTLPVVAASALAAVLQGLALTGHVHRLAAVLAGALAALTFAATCFALVVAVGETDSGRSPGVGGAFATGARRAALALPALVVAVVSLLLTSGSVVLLPIAVVLAAAWVLLVPVIVLESRHGLGGLRRSVVLAARCWRTLLPLLVLIVLELTTFGALVAALLFAVVPLPFVVLNAVPPVVVALHLPFLAAVAAYAYGAGVSATATTAPAAKSRPQTA